jgi:hypothetical protein
LELPCCFYASQNSVSAPVIKIAERIFAKTSVKYGRTAQVSANQVKQRGEFFNALFCFMVYFFMK